MLAQRAPPMCGQRLMRVVRRSASSERVIAGRGARQPTGVGRRVSERLQAPTGLPRQGMNTVSMQDRQLSPGDEVCALSTGRRMRVREVDGDRVRCAWFDGRAAREVTLPVSAVRLSSATGDDRVVTFARN
jgi:uncharacterized protein YodC (DUF2158 family)